MLNKLVSTLPVWAGLSILVFLPVIHPFLSPTFRMHAARPVQSMTVAIAILWLLSTLIGTILWNFIPSGSFKEHLFVFGLAVALSICLRDTLLLAGRPEFMAGHRPLLFSAMAFFVVLTWVRRSRASVYRHIRRGSPVLFAGLGLWAVIVVAQLLFIGTWRPLVGSVEARAFPDTHFATPHGRVVWILFDELAFEQTYGDRDADLPLPNLDALRQLSTLYTRVIPIGDRTELVVPGLLIGQKLGRIRSRFDNTLEIVPAGESKWRPYSDFPTLFAEARSLGYTNGIAGWYNSYCSFLAGQWNFCFWTFAEDTHGISANAGIFANIRSLAAAYTLRTAAPQSDERRISAETVRIRQQEYEALMEKARYLLSRPSFDFVFIHLSVPHPPAIYNRRTNKFGPGGSYLDSLVLMDIALGDLLEEMKLSAAWPQTSLVVSGDHAYRTSVWRAGPYWTPEDEQATRGAFDDRPLLLIHTAGQHSPDTVTAPTPLLVVHSVLEEMLRQNAAVSPGI